MCIRDRINYAFAIPTEDGEIRPLEHPEVAERLIREGHEHGVQVLISVGGWSYLDIPLEDTFIKATETPEKTEKLADAIAAMVEEYGFDGADIDVYKRQGYNCFAGLFHPAARQPDSFFDKYRTRHTLSLSLDTVRQALPQAAAGRGSLE